MPHTTKGGVWLEARLMQVVRSGWRRPKRARLRAEAGGRARNGPSDAGKVRGRRRNAASASQDQAAASSSPMRGRVRA